MAHSDLLFFLMTIVGFCLAGWHLCWICCDPKSGRGLWARRLGVSALLCLGSSGLVAAGLRLALVGAFRLARGIADCRHAVGRLRTVV